MAATSVGQQFQVQIAGDIIRYEHRTGGVAVEVGRSPSSSGLADIAAQVTAVSGVVSKAAGAPIAAVRGAAGGDMLRVLPSGQAVLSGSALTVQERLDRLERQQALIGSASGPWLARLDAGRMAAGMLIDQTGGMHLPGLGPHTVQDSIRRLWDELAGMASDAVSGQVVNAVSDLGCDPSGATDCAAIINAAQDTMAADPMRRAAIYYPRGDYLLTAPIVPRSRVSHFGAGMGATTFRPTSAGAFTQIDAWVEDIAFANFKVDGSAITSYHVRNKAFFFQGFRRVYWSHVWAFQTAATGFGVDFADRSAIVECIAEGCGARGSVGTPGCSGIGIGTKAAAEALIIANNHCIDNKNYGIFVERQSGLTRSDETVITSNMCRGNGFGIGECGGEGTVITGNRIKANIFDGIILHGGTVGGGRAGERTQITGNVISGNGRDGIRADTAMTRGYNSVGNTIWGNAAAGHQLADTAAKSDIRIGGDAIDGNAVGVHVQGGPISRLEISNSRLADNAAAIVIDAPVTHGRLHALSVYGATTESRTIAASGALTGVDIAECHAPEGGTIALTGAQSGVTIGRNPGFTGA